MPNPMPRPSGLLDAQQTAAALRPSALADEIKALLSDPAVRVPQRLVQPLPGGACLFIMPAHDGRLAISKLITLTPANAGSPRPVIQGDVVVFEVATGLRRLILDGPTVTARRTAAVSLLAARSLAPQSRGPLLIIGAGVQGRAHLEAYAEGLAVREVWVASRSPASARQLADHAAAMGLAAHVTDDLRGALARCPLVVTCTPATAVVLDQPLGSEHFLAAVGAFTPAMCELGPALCLHAYQQGRVVVDTPDAQHEAGDLLQAQLPVEQLETLAQALTQPASGRGPVLFKSCGWGGWDLAAARLACPG